jgi:hypothetical protein
MFGTDDDQPLLQSRRVSAVIPVARNTGRMRQEMFALLNQMELRECQEVRRSPRSVSNYLHLFKKLRESEWRFTIRKGEPGWTRIWRIK